jgi:hypothetical protein
MDPLLMVGAWAGAVLAVAAVGRLAYHGWVRAIRSVLREELGRVWKDQDEIEQRLHALELSMKFMREQLDRLTQMMTEHIREKV